MTACSQRLRFFLTSPGLFGLLFTVTCAAGTKVTTPSGDLLESLSKVARTRGVVPRFSVTAAQQPCPDTANPQGSIRSTTCHNASPDDGEIQELAKLVR